MSDPLWERTMQEYPALQKLDMNYTYTPKENSGYLEFWPSDETGSKDYPRPDALPQGKPGVEVYSPATRPIDIAGDIVSHHLVNEDPAFQKIYKDFESSLRPWQKAILKQQYEHAQANEGEDRPYDQWYGASGLPGYFRGYTFQQWDDPGYYTPDQRKLLDQVIPLLKR